VCHTATSDEVDRGMVAAGAYNQRMEHTSDVVGGRYRVLGNLGKGAMGLVYMAYDPVLDRKVAIKQMTAEIADNEELRQRFYVEARAAARLNHPNIITIHELQESGGDIFIIMELLEGKSFAALIQAKPVPLSIEATLDVMAQVCDGLDYAHQRAIVHRDIKPANLFLTPSGAVKILDFGIARLGSLHMTAAGSLIGTPDYMSPEQIRGDEIDRRTDLWAIGAVLYQLLSGTKPFEGKPLSRLLTAIAQTPHVPLQQRAASVPKSVSDLVDRLLAKPRDGRPASAALVRDELRAILGRESSASTKATLAADEYEETIFMSAPSTPPVAPSALAPAARPPAAPPLPPVEPAADRAARSSSVQPPEVERTVRLSAADAKPPAPLEATGPKAAAPAATVPPALPARPPALPARPPAPPVGPPAPPARPPAPPVGPPAPPPAPRVAVAPPVAPERPTAPGEVPAVAAPAAKGISMLVAAVVIVAVLGLAFLGGGAWWYFGNRPSAPSGGEPAAPEGAAAAAASQAGQPASQPIAETRSPALPPAGEPAAAPPAAPPSAPPAVTDRAEGQRLAPVPTRNAGGTPPAAPTATAGGAPTPAPPPARRGTQPGVETGVTAAPGAVARPGLSADTVDTFKGRTSGQGDDSVATLAAVNRINYVLEQYVRALVNGDTDGIHEYRAPLSPAESALMRARQLKVRLEGVRVEVNGTEAVARCRRKVEGTSATGERIEEDAVVTFYLVRRTAGWVITDVR
jgi:serine/threonine protein kinase